MTTPTDQDRARALIAKWEHGSEEHRQWLRDIATPDLLAAFAEVRDAAHKEHGEDCDLCGEPAGTAACMKCHAAAREDGRREAMQRANELSAAIDFACDRAHELGDPIVWLNEWRHGATTLPPSSETKHDE